MTTEEKKLKIIKMASTSDSDGVNEMYKKLFCKETKSDSNITADDIIQASAHVFAKMSVEDPELIILMPVFAHGISETLKMVFKEDK